MIKDSQIYGTGVCWSGSCGSFTIRRQQRELGIVKDREGEDKTDRRRRGGSRMLGPRKKKLITFLAKA